MDAKLLARSKRAHSQHHKNKSYSNQKSKSPAVAPDNAGSSAKKPLGKQVGEKTRQSQRIAKLPSNFDRYEDEFDLDSEGPTGENTGQSSDVIVPKSKGADYRYLLAEAQSQTQPQSCSYSDGFLSLDDVMPGGFTEGVCSMLSVRGEGILSWVGDDNFIVEEKTTAVQEASFLSLNLNALAEQLAKVDLSERLFVESDLLQLELGAEGSMASSNQQPGQTTHKSEAAANPSDDIDFSDFSVKVNIVDTESASFRTGSHVDATFSSRGPDLASQVTIGSNRFGKSGQSRSLEPTAQFKENSGAVSQKKLSEFAAAAAEAELDMLLDSFNETKFLDSTGSKSSNTVSDSQQAQSKTLPQVSRKGPDLSKPASVAASFDDVLDDLLEGSSNLMNQTGLSQPQNAKVVPGDTQSSSRSVTKSKVLDDFDSWLDTI